MIVTDVTSAVLVITVTAEVLNATNVGVGIIVA